MAKNLFSSHFALSPSNSCQCGLVPYSFICVFLWHAVFEQVTKNAVRGLWARRSKLNLVGAHINVFTGEWTQKVHSIFYLLKLYIYWYSHTYRHICVCVCARIMTIFNLFCDIIYFYREQILKMTDPWNIECDALLSVPIIVPLIWTLVLSK